MSRKSPILREGLLVLVSVQPLHVYLDQALHQRMALAPRMKCYSKGNPRPKTGDLRPRVAGRRYCCVLV